MYKVRVGRRGQITIPSSVRRQIGIQEGDQIALLPHGEQLILHPMTLTLFDIRGSVPVSEPLDFISIREQVIASRTRRTRANDS